MSVMLYKKPGKHKMHGDTFDYIVVDESEVDRSTSQGWCKTTTEAKEAYLDKDVKRENLTAKASEYGEKVDGRTSIDKLETLVTDKIEEEVQAETLRIF